MEPKENKPHKNIRGKEYYAHAIEEATQRQNPVQTPILRLREFVRWAHTQALCKSEFDFERICGLSPKYIANNASTGKGNIGTEMLGRIIKAFPRLNLAWICTGDGSMLMDGSGDLNADYKLAYEGAMMQVEALNRILHKHDIIRAKNE